MEPFDIEAILKKYSKPSTQITSQTQYSSIFMPISNQLYGQDSKYSKRDEKPAMSFETNVTQASESLNKISLTNYGLKQPILNEELPIKDNYVTYKSFEYEKCKPQSPYKFDWKKYDFNSQAKVQNQTSFNLSTGVNKFQREKYDKDNNEKQFDWQGNKTAQYPYKYTKYSSFLGNQPKSIPQNKYSSLYSQNSSYPFYTTTPATNGQNEYVKWKQNLTQQVSLQQNLNQLLNLQRKNSNPTPYQGNIREQKPNIGIADDSIFNAGQSEVRQKISLGQNELSTTPNSQLHLQSQLYHFNPPQRTQYKKIDSTSAVSANNNHGFVPLRKTKEQMEYQVYDINSFEEQDRKVYDRLQVTGKLKSGNEAQFKNQKFCGWRNKVVYDISTKDDSKNHLLFGKWC